MTSDLARLMAAQAKADEIARTVGESPEPGRHLRVAITDPETEQRLATCFVNVEIDAPMLRLVGEAP
ncbi:hypothetical protein OOK27_05330 [Streptomyces canus]|uniref:hypothetical protein n=1 Tax=Streptomyces canus TaxID=58343 RepID=UPI002256A826|nr:hypothetical protein [Streptomyces canus]MCX5253595.1 hypothetical protein [Streptomyces canus]